MAAPQPLSLGRKLLYALVPLAVLSLALELGARALLPAAPPPDSRGAQFRSFIRLQMPLVDLQRLLEFDPVLFWRLRPDTPDVPIRHDKNLWIDVATNSRGLRDDEVRLPKPAGVVRVLCVGDSTTYGTGVRRAESWPQVLEALVGDAGAAPEGTTGPRPVVDVVNAGVPGWTAYQCVQWLEREGWDLEPDIVVLTAGFNDERTWDDRSDEEHAASIARGASSMSRLIDASRFLGFLKDVVQTWRGLSLELFDTESTTPRLSTERFRHWLGRAAEAAEGRGVALALLLWPTGDNLDAARASKAASTRGPHQRALADFAAEHGLPLIDPLPALVRLDEDVFLFDRVHMTPAGNAVVAAEVEAALRRQGWLVTDGR